MRQDLSDWAAPAPALPGPTGPPMAPLHRAQGDRVLSLTRGIDFGVQSCMRAAAGRNPHTLPRYPCV